MPTKAQQRERRHARIRAKVTGTASCPRLTVFRSLNFTYAQLIDDAKGITLLSHSDVGSKEKGTKTERAAVVGKEIAKKAQEKGISQVVFDRNGYRYHGRTKAVAEGAREGGLQF